MHSRDIVVLAYLSTRPIDEGWTVRGVAEELGLPSAGVHRSFKRLERTRLLSKAQGDLKPMVVRERACEYLIHAVKYNFPAKWLPQQRGVLAAWSVDSIRLELGLADANAGQVVWPTIDGDEIGTGIQPLHEIVPATSFDRVSGELTDTGHILTLVDTIRYGHVRARSAAEKLLIRNFSLNPDLASAKSSEDLIERRAS